MKGSPAAAYAEHVFEGARDPDCLRLPRDADDLPNASGVRKYSRMPKAALLLGAQYRLCSLWKEVAEVACGQVRVGRRTLVNFLCLLVGRVASMRIYVKWEHQRRSGKPLYTSTLAYAFFFRPWEPPASMESTYGSKERKGRTILRCNGQGTRGRQRGVTPI